MFAMADNVSNELLLENLKSLQGVVAELRSGQERIERRLGTIEDFVGTLVKANTATNVDYDDLRRRLERIERRLALEPGE